MLAAAPMRYRSTDHTPADKEEVRRGWNKVESGPAHLEPVQDAHQQPREQSFFKLFIKTLSVNKLFFMVKTQISF